MDNLHLVFSKMKARLKWGLNHAKDLESWAEGIRLLDEFYYFESAEPRLGVMNLMRYIPLVYQKFRYFSFQIDLIKAGAQGETIPWLTCRSQR